ncbi:MAG: hypothetical protein IKG86_07805 [Paludibacteraceae bacterium]|nr:hypothetical protein [Paludibacteraceae bacterium]
MDVNVRNISEYIEKMVGAEVQIEPLDKAKRQALPVLITNAYQLLQCQLLGAEVSLMVCKDANATPMQLKKHCAIVERALEMHAAVVLPEVKPYNMKRLVDARVNTIVPGRQLFLPSLLMDLRVQRNPVDMVGKPMPVMAQVVVLYHLQKHSLNWMSAQPIAELMDVSYPNINRAVKWLADNGFVELSLGREKQMQFIHEGKELWEQALPVLQSPIERVLRTDRMLDAYVCGEEALAELTMLAEPQERHWAITKQEAQQLGAELHKEFGEHVVEVWRYNPKLMGENGMVDRLSLYLSLRDTEDERVRKEVKGLVIGKW